jgi:4,5:9,10-diseco-3-hydroxy-5,9,17-trioxoandrosta-1(10),2-diene-4-oate hydrolase
MDLTRHPAIKTCETPTLVLWGRQDAINRPSGGEMLTSRMRNCDLYMVANVGHWVQWGDPGVVQPAGDRLSPDERR